MAELNFTKLQSNKVVGLWMGPTATGVLGITDVGEPLAAEINNTGGTSGMQPAHQSVSWSDFGFGVQASDTLNEPSLSDASTYETFGKSNYGGNVSHWMPDEYDDNSNMHSVIYDLTAVPNTKLDVVMSVDGYRLATDPIVDGDFVSAYRVQSAGETNPFTPGESVRRTINLLQKSDFSHMVVVGDHAITTIPATTSALAVAAKGRFRGLQQDRDVTCYLDWSTSDATKVQVYPGGFYTAVAAGSATVTATDPETGDTASIAVTVS